MPTYKLNYFNGRGRGEVARVLFAVAGVKYEDNRIEFADWPKIKPTTPVGSLPVLEVDGKIVATSQAINRHLAREFKLYGKNNEEHADVDMVCEVLLDIFTPMIQISFEKDEKAKEEKQKKFMSETIPTMCGYMEKKLDANNGGNSFFVGDSITLADVFFFVLMEMFLAPGKNENGLDKFPKLKALYGRLGAQKQIAEWVKARPQTQF